jgi:sugar phosphate permease
MSAMEDNGAARPSRIRFGILVLATLIALLLYLDRYCLSTSDKLIQDTMKFSDRQMALIQSAFFFAYALGQIPMGWLSDRGGVRATLSCYVIFWSAFTGLIGAINGVVDFVIYRLGCGLSQAGTYPACAGMIRLWFPENMRGTASGIVSLGGRVGGTVAPLVVAYLIALFSGWRAAMIGLGLFGVVYGAGFLLFFRNRPRQHPWVNADEAALIEGAAPVDDTAGPAGTPWQRLVTHPSLWLSSFIQFGINFGWVFILTNLNRFLGSYFNVPDDVRPGMISIVMLCSLPALILGGRLTDIMTTRYGKRWGRALPMAVPRFASAACYLLLAVVLAVGEEVNPWTVIVLMGTMVFFSDLSLPAIWGFNLDVGKRHVGLVLGWGNMWGNLGAFVTPLAVDFVVNPQEGLGLAWPWVFAMFGAVFTVIGVAALFIRADDPLEPDA